MVTLDPWEGRFGPPWTCFWALWGGQRVSWGTPRVALGAEGVTWEPEGLPKWVPPMPGRHLGTILELPGWIWGASLVSFWCRFGHIFG